MLGVRGEYRKNKIKYFLLTLILIVFKIEGRGLYSRGFMGYWNSRGGVATCVGEDNIGKEVTRGGEFCGWVIFLREKERNGMSRKVL